MVLLACTLGLWLVACAPREQRVQLRFSLEDAASVHRLQFYVHDVALIGDDDRIHPFELEQRSPWQSDRVALLDFSGSQSTLRDVIDGKATQRRYTGIRFTVGVPFSLNHANQLTAKAPLNRADMFWSWQSGYKFLRLDLAAGEHEAAFHLGSTGCSSVSALRPPRQPCAQPNLIQVELKGFDPLAQPIQVRVNEIVAALGEAKSRACTGDYEQPACADAFATTGLDVKSGRCAGASVRDEPAQARERPCARQRLFAIPGLHPLDGRPL
jgi:uncharacterized repeat protein (TIGR04052 family)